MDGMEVQVNLIDNYDPTNIRGTGELSATPFKVTQRWTRTDSEGTSPH